ncbi:NAD(P)H-dependent flavin oxidoreductase [Marinobacterium rhizophilum]|uniref:Propionate 3-nitronate monooxygenase n=1 Tax=Marinobacterium rhizophilum TaxID=420402 RepID=A0ABY5HM78_9GAMM|nr:nitronate monooxygenase [Marinobacterium rhizophilum]UTW13405.1 nitronate monooxygenase [Marinobacterium rhizophilum]
MTLQQLLGITLPIIQAPMAGAQGHALAAAVCNAGGLGSLPCAMLSAESLQAELEALCAVTRQPFNVNFFCHTAPEVDEAREAGWRQALAPFYREFGLDMTAIPPGVGRAPFSEAMADVLEPFRPAVVSFHFGLPSEALLARVKGWGSRVMCSATTVEEAIWLESRGVDILIAQGLEAGGHRGHFLSPDLTRQSGTFALLPQVVQAVSIPVVAAGGIADGAGIRAALALGAVGAQLGTAYLLCPESLISHLHRAALQSPAAHHTALTNLFTGRPARGIVNRLLRELGPLSDAVPAFPLATTGIGPLRAAAEKQGSGDFTPLWCGQNASGCRAMPAGDLTRQLGAGLAD